MTTTKRLTRFAWLSLATAVATIALKATAYWLTGSVGLLSDALESGVNLVSATVALAALTIAAQPPDEEHAYGHDKAEYFASGVEGTLIIVAAATIAYSAGNRLLNPQPLQQVGVGLAVSVVASLLNLVVARILLHAGRTYRSITLEANGRHLLTDVWTSAGVVAGVALVALTNWHPLDPLLALAVAIHILAVGWRLISHSISGLMDTALPAAEIQKIRAILELYEQKGVYYHALRTRQSGAQRFVSLHVQVPGEWTVQEGHALLEEMERDLREAIPPISVFTHLEPLEDPVSWHDITLNRK
jgi:cation diffusion facilitator family transporter